MTHLALKDLYELQDTDDFAVREKAFEYLKNGELTIEDFKFYANSAGRKQITKKKQILFKKFTISKLYKICLTVQK